MMDLFITNVQFFMLIDELVFISCSDSHSDGTHSLQRKLVSKRCTFLLHNTNSFCPYNESQWGPKQHWTLKNKKRSETKLELNDENSHFWESFNPLKDINFASSFRGGGGGVAASQTLHHKIQKLHYKTSLSLCSA